MKARPSRREFLKTTTAGVSAAIAGGCGTNTGSAQAWTLRVFVYAGGHERTMREVFVPAFEKLTGAKVVLDPGWWDALAKLKAAPAGNPPYDLVVTDATQGYPAIKEGLFRQLDLGRIPNHKNLTPTVLDNHVFRERYGITYPNSVMTLAYHKELAKPAPETWADLLRPDLAGRIALYNSFYMSLHTFGCMKVAAEGKPGTAHDLMAKDLDAVLAFAKEHRARVKFWWPTSTDMSLGLRQKDCAAGNMHSPEYLQVLRENPALGAVVPETDRAFVQGFWAVPDGCPCPDLAEQAIDVLFSVELQTEFARRGSATAVLEAARTVANEDPFWKDIYPHTEEQFRSLRYYPYDAYFAHWDDIVAVWDRDVLRKS
jgi:spermidine/putrescine-binding protein